MPCRQPPGRAAAQPERPRGGRLPQQRADGALRGAPAVRAERGRTRPAMHRSDRLWRRGDPRRTAMPRTLHVQHDRFALTRPVRIARGEKIAADVITLTLGEGGAVGRGEGAPYPRYGETVETAIAAIEAIRPALEGGAGRATLATLLPPGAARNAVDCAMWDLEARLAGCDVAAMIGASAPARLASALTIVIATPAVMAAAAAEIADAPLLKVKVNAEDIETRLRAVRAVAPDARMIVAPNESWDEALVRGMEGLLGELRVDLLERPVPAADDGWL